MKTSAESSDLGGGGRLPLWICLSSSIRGICLRVLLRQRIFAVNQWERAASLSDTTSPPEGTGMRNASLVVFGVLFTKGFLRKTPVKVRPNAFFANCVVDVRKERIFHIAYLTSSLELGLDDFGCHHPAHPDLW